MKRQHLRYLSGVLVVALCLLTCPFLSALSDTAVVYSAAECVQNGMLDEDTIRGLYNGINAVTRATQYNESGTNTSFSSADTIPVDEAAGSETHMFGKISSSNTADYYKITPPRHGRIYVMLLSPTGYSYNLTVYNSNENVLSCDYSTSTTKSFMATKGTKTSANLASYYIKVTSSSGYSTSNYRVIVFYALNYRNLEFAYPTTSTLTRLSSPVGYRTYNSEYHTGVDIPGSTSDTIYSVCNAVVLRAYDQTYLSDGSLGMGKFVQATTAFSTGSGYSNILDPYTNTVYTMRYMHMSELYVNTAYSNGTQIITKGTEIGKMGTTGASSGVHLHFDMNNGNHTLSADIKNDLQSLINPVDLYDVSFTGSAY